MLDGLPWPWIIGMSRLEQVQDVLGARCRPEGEQVMVRVREGSAAADRHQARVAHRRKDHDRLPLRMSGSLGCVRRLIILSLNATPFGEYIKQC